MKFIFTVILFFVFSFSFSQSGPRFTIRLKQRIGEQGVYVSSIDTIYLTDEKHQCVRQLVNVPARDSVFEMDGIPVGKYQVHFFLKDQIITPFPVCVCSRCRNQYEFFARPIQKGDNRGYFTRIEVSPSYIGDVKSLSKDFQKALTREERRMVRSAPAFTVSFFVTKEGVSDVRFIPEDLAPELQKVILKGLTSLQKWMLGMLNGYEVDDEMELNKEQLLSK